MGKICWTVNDNDFSSLILLALVQDYVDMNIREDAVLKIDLCPCCSKKSFYSFMHLGIVMFPIP